MLADSKAFSGFAVDDVAAAKQFYSEVLGVKVEDQGEMGLVLHLGGGLDIFVYPKPDHEAAKFTILNFPVDDIDAAIDDLVAKGVVFERYDNLPAEQDEKGVLRNDNPGYGPTGIAWFKDPADNILSVLQQ